MGKKILQTLMFVLSIALNIAGITSLLHVIGVVNLGFLSFYGNLNLILTYAIIIAMMSVGIMLFNAFAGTCRNKLKNGLSIGCCIYSTILTVPLLLSFVGCFFAVNGIKLPVIGGMIADVVVAFQSLIKSVPLQYLVFSAGILLSIIFLAVPIIMCVTTVKGKKRAKRSF